MISHIFGDISQSGEGYVVIDVAGIGYHVNVPKNDIAGTRRQERKSETPHIPPCQGRCSHSLWFLRTEPA